MCVEKNARARIHTHIHIIVKNVVLATQHEQSFTPVHSSPRVTLWSFEGSEGRGCRSERERGFAGIGGRAGRGAATKKRERQGDERKERSEAGVWGGTFTGHLEFAAPTTDGIRAPFPPRTRFRPSFPVRPWFWSRVTPPTVHPRAAN